MSSLIKFVLAGVLGVSFLLVYLYTQKVYVDGRNVNCVLIADRFANGLENSFDYRYKCDVTFNVINLTSEAVEASYSARNVKISTSGSRKPGSVHLGSQVTGSVSLNPRETKKVSVVVGSDFEKSSVKIKAWANDRSI